MAFILLGMVLAACFWTGQITVMTIILSIYFLVLLYEVMKWD